jgi:hypothetical protein
MGTTADLKLQVDKGEFDILVLCGNALDIEANGAEAGRQDSDHTAAVFYLNSEAYWIIPFHRLVPVKGNQPVSLLSHFQKIAATIPVHH